MRFFKPTRTKIIFTILLASFHWLTPYFFASLTPNGLGGAYIGAFFFLLLSPSTYLANWDNYNGYNNSKYTVFYIFDFIILIFFSYLIVCIITYIIDKYKGKKNKNLKNQNH